MTTLVIYRPFERLWRWGTLAYWLALLVWIGASGLLHPGGSVTKLQFLAFTPGWISQALLGLYTGQVESVRGVTANRDKRPVFFWYLFVGNLILAAIFALPLLWHTR